MRGLGTFVLIAALGLPNLSWALTLAQPSCVSDTGAEFHLFGNFEDNASMWQAVSGGSGSTIIFVNHASTEAIVADGVEKTESLKMRELVGVAFDGLGVASFSMTDFENILGLYSERVQSGGATRRMLGCIEEIN